MASWFKRPTPEYINITGPQTKALKDRIPTDLWWKCPKCGTIILRKDFEADLYVCRACGLHERVSAEERIRQLTDRGTFKEMHSNLIATDPLQFEAGRNYKDHLAATRKKTGINDSLVMGKGMMGETPVALAVMEFSFMGGSMGSVLGEKVARAMELAIEQKIPCITVTSTGGARMQEGILSLMQMAKTSILCAQMERAGVPFISVLADPSTAGVMASFASLGDLVIAEPGAYVGFAGKRVIEQTIKQQLPANFQTSEFQKEHGFVDMVVRRKDLRPTIIRVLRMMMGLPVWQDPSEASAAGTTPLPISSSNQVAAAKPSGS
ncbi:acetyl-CoA carboxylase, carboxyltransferase subunit beta [soil metagenome]